MDPMMQDEQQMSMMNYDQSDPSMVPNINPIISEERVFDDYREDQMMEMDPHLDSRPGRQQQDYYDSEYRPTITSPHPHSSPPPPFSSQQSHATASTRSYTHDSSKVEVDDSEKSMTPKAMAAFQQHQDILESNLGIGKRNSNNVSHSGHEASSSIPCSSDMISVKNIEDREDEYSKMKLALLSDLAETSNNGASSPFAAITSPSLAPNYLYPRGKEEKLSSVHRDKPNLGPRTRSKDNLGSIFGGTVEKGDVSDKFVSKTSVVHKPLQDNKNIALTSNFDTMSNVYEGHEDNGMSSTSYPSRLTVEPPVNTAISSALLSSSTVTTCNSRANRSHNLTNDKNKRANKDTLNTSQNINTNNFTLDAKHLSSPSQQAKTNHYPNEGVNSYETRVQRVQSYEYCAVPTISTSNEASKHTTDTAHRAIRHKKPTGCVKEESFPLDISPESHFAPTDVRSSKIKAHQAGMGAGDKKGITSTVPNISSSATGDVYTIPEVPEEDETSSPLGVDGVSKRRMAGRSSQCICSYCIRLIIF